MCTEDQAQAKAYHRRKLWLSLIAMVLGVVYLAAWLPVADHLVAWARSIADQRWIGLAVTAAAIFLGHELLNLPLNYYEDYILEHRFGLSNQTRLRWLVQTAKGWLVGGVLGGVLLVLFYVNLWYLGPLWWLWLWIGLFVLSVVLAQLFPTLILPIFHKAEPLEDDHLRSRLAHLAAGAGLAIRGIYRLNLSTDTRKANAMLAGLGKTRRVLLADTLLDGFAPGEIEVVFAHELGHHVHRHIPKLLVLNTLVSVLLIVPFWLVLNGVRGPANDLWPRSVAALPVIGLISAGVSLVLRPLLNFVSRRMETQSDRYALRRTADANAYRSAFHKLARRNLADPDPHPLIEWFFYDHPPIKKRLALAPAPEAAPRTPSGN